MARYLQTAAEANKEITAMIEMVETVLEVQPDLHQDLNLEALKAHLSRLVAKSVNYGLRCAPRAVQSTVRLNAVKRAVEGLPVAVSMTQVTDEHGRSYNRLDVS